MVIKNYNHPSVVMNSIGNEISELAMPEGQEYCKKLAVLARKLDPDKAVTMGVNLMLCSMSAKGGGIYGNKKEWERESKRQSDDGQCSHQCLLQHAVNLAGGMIEKMAAKPAADDATKVSFSYLDIWRLQLRRVPIREGRYAPSRSRHCRVREPCPRTCIITGNW